jgi:hypothetical protein
MTRDLFLSTDPRLHGIWCAEESFCVSQSLRGVDILPFSLADVECPELPPGCQTAHPIRERTVSIPHGRFERVKEGRSAQKHARIERIVMGNVFPDIDNLRAAPQDLSGVVEIEDPVDVGVHGQDNAPGSDQLIQHAPRGSGFEDMIGHH